LRGSCPAGSKKQIEAWGRVRKLKQHKDDASMMVAPEDNSVALSGEKKRDIHEELSARRLKEKNPQATRWLVLDRNAFIKNTLRRGSI